MITPVPVSFFAMAKKECIYVKNYATIKNKQVGFLRIRRDILQQKTYAFLLRLYESGGIQTGA
jgi:hypothetical protein